MTTAWAHLPNAKHIDRVLADLSARPEVWDAARAAAWDDSRGDALGGVWAAARNAALYAIHGAALDAARDAIRALIAWDDCSELLDLPPDAVRLLAASGHHPAVLLYPAVLAFNTETA